MKRVFVFSFLFALMGFTSQAQYKENALGIRLRGGTTSGAEISFQRAVSNNNRVEFDLGLGVAPDLLAFRLIGIYQRVWNIEGGLNWYAGIGAGFGALTNYNLNGFATVSLDGQIGIEYIFTGAPIQLAIDNRPAFFVLSNDDIFFENNIDIFNLGLSVRYQFN